jgi:hypothetical protein
MNEIEEKDAFIAEYESLRNEILEHQDRREKLFLYTISALGVVLAFLVNSKEIAFAIVSFVPYFLIYNFCHSVKINSSHIITLGTYIRNFISPEYKKAFRWEIVWDLKSKSSERESKKTNYFKGGGYWYNFSVLSTLVSCFGVSFLTVFTDTYLLINLSEKVIFLLSHLTFCILVLTFGSRKIHWGNLNKLSRAEKNNFWKASKELLENENNIS